MGGNVHVKSGSVRDVLQATTTTTTGQAIYKDAPKSAIQANVVGTGTVSATVIIDCSNDGVLWCSTVLGTITLSGTTSSSDGFTTDAPWKFIRARVTAITGTGATVTVTMGT